MELPTPTPAFSGFIAGGFWLCLLGSKHQNKTLCVVKRMTLSRQLSPVFHAIVPAKQFDQS